VTERDLPTPKEFQNNDIAIEIRNFSAGYGELTVLENFSLSIPRNRITALIGHSGSGKSTLLLAINRMNELNAGYWSKGSIFLEGKDIYKDGYLEDIRKHAGMVFQKPNPFPKSIFENVAFGLRIWGVEKNAIPGIVERSLNEAGLWEEVKDILNEPGMGLSGGQQQRLCIARALAIEPSVLLLDEPCTALDPLATEKIEQLLRGLRKERTIFIVTHNLDQARRLSDYIVFLAPDKNKVGRLVEYDTADKMSTNPQNKLTEEYMSGKLTEDKILADTPGGNNPQSLS